MAKGKTYWMVTNSLTNFNITKDMGFRFQGLMSRQKRKAQRMEPGDRLIFYITGIQKFGATATITSKCTEDHSLIWESHGKPEDFPWRVQIKPENILENEECLDANQICPRMEHVKKWPPEFWELAFQGNLHILPKADLEFLEQEMVKVVSKRH